MYSQARHVSFLLSQYREGRPNRYCHVLWRQVGRWHGVSTWWWTLSETLSCNVSQKLGDQSIFKASVKTACSICTHHIIHTLYSYSCHAFWLIMSAHFTYLLTLVMFGHSVTLKHRMSEPCCYIGAHFFLWRYKPMRLTKHEHGIKIRY